MPYSRRMYRELMGLDPATGLPLVAIGDVDDESSRSVSRGDIAKREVAFVVDMTEGDSLDANYNNLDSFGSREDSSVTQDLQPNGEKVKHDRKIEKKCIKCKTWWPYATHFGVHNTSSDGYQSICKNCKKDANKEAQKRNVGARVRHHTATRCLEQLKGHVPSGFTKEMEKHLGYKIVQLVRHLRTDLHEREGAGRSLKDALNDGYHIDHIKPLSSYTVIVDGEVDWDAFRECWRIENLSAIPARENLVKGAKYTPKEEE